MNQLIHCSRSLPAWGWKMAALSLVLLTPISPIWAQGPPVLAPAYAEYPGGVDPRGPIQQVQLPTPNRYYEYLPGNRRDDRIESPLDRLLKQSIRQTYGRFDYLHWQISNPGTGIIGAPGKKLLDGEGFSSPSFIDPVRGPEVFDGADEVYPVRRPLLNDYPRPLVLIQIWDSTEDVDDTGIVDNDIDVFPRLTNAAKQDILLGNNFDVLYTSGLNQPGITGATGEPTAAQVAVLTAGQLGNSSEFSLDNTNGFRGVFGLNTTFGAVEMNFFALDSAESGFQFNVIPPGFLDVPGAGGVGGQAIDPMVIPVLVNDQIAPDIFDDDGVLITDSNNYYLIFNDTYSATFESNAWGLAPNIYWELYQRPDRFSISSSLGFRYFDLQERMFQQGTFSDDEDIADFVYDNEAGLADGEVLTTIIDSNTVNKVYGPQAGLRAQFGDERISFGVDTNVMLGANSYEASVLANDVGIGAVANAGDEDNFTEVSATEFTAGFEMLLDARIRLREHVSLSVGYNFLWFSGVSRPHDNIYYNIDATAATPPVPAEGPDFTFANDIQVRKEKTDINLSGLSIGLLIDW